MRLGWIVAAAAFALDRATKMLTTANLAPGERVKLLPGVAELWHTQNTGVAFGLLSESRPLSMLLSPLAVIALLLLLRKADKTPLLLTAQGLILGGFAGNYLDRLLAGAVTDMLFFPWLPFFVCNAADVAVCAGVALLAVGLFTRPSGRREA